MSSKKKEQLLIRTESGFQCQGMWSILHLADFTKHLTTLDLPQHQPLRIEGEQLTAFDSSGALALTHCLDKLTDLGNTYELKGFSPDQQALLSLIHQQKSNLTLEEPHILKEHFLTVVGRETLLKLKQIDDFVILLGGVTAQFIRAVGHVKRFQFRSIISIVHSTGIHALPILALLSFLIGIVLAYQMGLQLQTYGATTFIAYLSGMAIFREFGPLITAIIVAGRTSSAFTAQLGSMVVNEEVDAIQAMGLSPIELLVLPKVLGLLFVFPLLIFWSDLFSILGAMLMSQLTLNLSYADFLEHLQDSIDSRQFLLGLYKAPIFAMLISMVGCFQGFRVLYRTDSIGIQTTKSVVQALFLIIIADAIYSIIYSWMDL